MTSKSTIPEYTAKDPTHLIASALDEAGCVVVHDMLADSEIDHVKDELAPHMLVGYPMHGSLGFFDPRLRDSLGDQDQG